MEDKDVIVYRYSASKGVSVPVSEMHPCHIINAMKKEFMRLTAKEILAEPLFQAYFDVLSKHIHAEAQNIEFHEM